MAEQHDGVEDAPGKTAGGGESAGGAYPNPQSGKRPGGVVATASGPARSASR